ncbi:hypothetical protein LptCag_0194 [Leptospirillum ferriphilum]|uniref:Uncharacterized protein n=1 Tax=Leptospirillum ferriphilum TaxID=178606 RepID=A0A094YK72_9BACT|nr:hypothetical protein LptCag_0194 [Leptospirillum ferriphilum]
MSGRDVNKNGERKGNKRIEGAGGSSPTIVLPVGGLLKHGLQKGRIQ